MRAVTSMPRRPWARGLVRAALGFALCLPMASCADSSEVKPKISFTNQVLADQVARIELSLLESCAGLANGAEATDLSRRWSLVRGGAVPDLGDLDPGTHALYARGFSDECAVIAAGCSEFTAASGKTKTVDVVLEAVSGAAGCTGGAACVDATCVGQVDDGSVDTGTDAPPAVDVCPGKPDGTACTIDSLAGRCVADACCTGCEQGGECKVGNAKSACGRGGDACDVCECGSDACSAEATCVPAERIESVSLATEHGCAVTDDGGLWCWGSDDSEKLGLGATVAPRQCVHERGVNVVSFDCFPTPRELTAPSAETDWRSVSLGDSSSCALDSVGALFCWGTDFTGQLGNGPATSNNVASPQRVGSDTWKAVSSASGAVCAIRSDNTLWCWGSNADGQLGLGVVDANRNAPTQVTEAAFDAADSWTAISGGSQHFCGLRDGDVYCWGNDETSRAVYETPTDTVTDKPSPVRVTDTGGFAEVLTGVYTTCARKSGTSETTCWGNNQYATFGTAASGVNVASPPTVVPWSAASAVALRNSYHACGVTTTGALTCWGRATYGQLGNGVDPPAADSTATPVAVLGDWKWSRAATGRNFTCAVREDGRLYCWGRAQTGQTGRADLTPPAVPGVAGDLTYHNATPGRVCFEP